MVDDSSNITSLPQNNVSTISNSVADSSCTISSLLTNLSYCRNITSYTKMGLLLRSIYHKVREKVSFVSCVV